MSDTALTIIRVDLVNTMFNMRTAMNGVAAYLDYVGDHLLSGDVTGAGTNAKAAAAQMYNLYQAFGTNVSSPTNFLSRLAAWTSYVAFNFEADVEPYELTMDDLLNTMLGASFENLTQFMGITEAYKVAVWDAPFNEEFYAALARGFRQWGI